MTWTQWQLILYWYYSFNVFVVALTFFLFMMKGESSGVERSLREEEAALKLQRQKEKSYQLKIFNLEDVNEDGSDELSLDLRV